MAEHDLSAERLRSLLSYSAETGAFTWRVSASPRVSCGKPAGRPDRRGYVIITVDGKSRYAHRLAWLYVNGEWPTQQVDHINGIKSDNRIGNLRDISASANTQNQIRPQRGSTTGLLGVSKAKDRRKFRACIKVSDCTVCIGSFDTAESAHAAYIEAKRALHAGNTL